jgi:hypothetical protein
MTPTSSSAYPLGFICATDAARLNAIPATFREVEFELPLHCHPKTVHTHIVRDRSALIILGNAFHTEFAPPTSEHAVAALINALDIDEGQCCNELRFICGRYAIIYSCKGGPFKVLNDATAMRSVFYARDSDGMTIGSHAHLVNAQRFNPASLQPIPMRWGYPGVSTPLEGVRLLTANTRLNLGNGEIERFYPVLPIPKNPVEESANFIASRVERLIGHVTDTRQAILSITAGIDSRTTLALSLQSSSKIKYFTYRSDAAATHIDAAFCQDVTRSHHLDHRVIDISAETELNQAWKNVMVKNSYYSHGQRLGVAYYRHFGDNKCLHIRSNLLEIGRCFYTSKRVPVPDAATNAASLYLKMSPATAIEHADMTRKMFAEYWSATTPGEAMEMIDPYDLFYWEHRMSAWHALLLLESDIAFDTFIPFNARCIFEAMLAVPVDYRKRGDVFRRIIRMKAPELAELPINPLAWPGGHAGRNGGSR